MAEASECSLAPGSATAKPRLLVRSRASPKHHPASSPGRAHLGRWRYRTASRAPSAEVAGPAEAAKGSAPASSPWDPAGRMPAQAPRGCCPGRAAARRTRDIPTEFRAASARRRQFGGDASPRGPSRIRRCAPPPGHIDRQAEQGGLASAADRENPGKSPAARKAPQKLLRERRTRVGRSQRACRTPSAPPIAARGRTCPKGPENGLGAGSCVAASARSAIAAPNAPQERRQACTRTPRRRRRSGWTGP